MLPYVAEPFRTLLQGMNIRLGSGHQLTGKAKLLLRLWQFVTEPVHISSKQARYVSQVPEDLLEILRFLEGREQVRLRLVR